MTACLFGSQTGHERTNHTNFLPSWIQKNFWHTAKESALLNALCIVAWPSTLQSVAGQCTLQCLCSVSCDNAVCSVSCDKALQSIVTMHFAVCRVTLQCVAWQICTLWRVKMHPAVCHVTCTVQCVKWQCTLQFVAWQWTLHFVVGQYTLQCVAWRDGTFPQEWTTSRGMICY